MEHIRRLVQELVTAGYQLDRSAYEYLQTMSESDSSSFAKDLLLNVGRITNRGQVLTKQELIEIQTLKPPIDVLPSVTTTIPAKQISSRVEIIKDPSQTLSAGSGISDFSHYFRDRFEKLAKVFRQRLDARDAGSLSVALKAGQNEKVKFLAMLLEKRERNQKIFFEVDDLEDAATVLVTSDDRSTYETAQRVPLDQVICVSAVRARGDLFVAKDIVLPDIPEHKPHLAEEDVWAVLLSDWHVGSKKFLADELQRALDWLSLRVGNPNQRVIAERTKYVVICGDIVDGIGVYPRQEQELAITELYGQYEEAAKYVGMIPEHVDVIILPGNHDAVRQALPQPSLPKEFAEPLYRSRQLISLGNPSQVLLHNVNFLLHHGRSLDDILAGAPGMRFTEPEKGMRLQLQCRHLAPEYGNRTAIAPNRTDQLAIEIVPDVFQSGHIHVVAHETYRGTQVINSGAWQSQTDYQRRMGLTPTPGILTAVNLRTLQVHLINFMSS
jgi:DNA polymerase II small subunit